MTRTAAPGPTERRWVVVGFDGSPNGKQALAWAARWARQTGAPMRVVSVVDWPTVSGVPVTWTHTSPIQFARRLADDAVEEVAGDLHEVEVDVEVGRPAATLVARAQDASVLIVGRRGLSKAERLVLGSVSSAVLHAAPCTVCVVPVHD